MTAEEINLKNFRNITTIASSAILIMVAITLIIFHGVFFPTHEQIMDKMASNVCWKRDPGSARIFFQIVPKKNNDYNIRCHWENGTALQDGSFVLDTDGWDDNFIHIKQPGEE